MTWFQEPMSYDQRMARRFEDAAEFGRSEPGRGVSVIEHLIEALGVDPTALTEADWEVIRAQGLEHAFSGQAGDQGQTPTDPTDQPPTRDEFFARVVDSAIEKTDI